MALSSNISEDGSELTIAVEGRFDFHVHQAFRRSYEILAERPRVFVVDLRHANYLDSSALGMLLLLRDHAGGERDAVKIVNANPEIRKILAISNFEQLFTIR